MRFSHQYELISSNSLRKYPAIFTSQGGVHYWYGKTGAGISVEIMDM